MNRQGFTILECLVACALLGAMAMICLQFFAGSAENRRAMNEQIIATQEAANLLERFSTNDWEQTTPDAARALRLSPLASKALREGEVEVQVGEPSGKPPAKRIVAIVRWRPWPNQPARQVRFVTWKYGRSE